MNIINVGVGFMILISGRPAYFVFTGAAGFILGAYFTDWRPTGLFLWDTFYIPGIFAGIGIALAIAFRRWAAYAAGFLAGGYLVYNLPQVFGAGQPAWATPVTFAIGGILCAVVLYFAFDFFLMFLSSVTAVTLILRGIRIGSVEPVIMFVILLVFGVIVQYLIFEYGHPAPD